MGAWNEKGSLEALFLNGNASVGRSQGWRLVMPDGSLPEFRPLPPQNQILVALLVKTMVGNLLWLD